MNTKVCKVCRAEKPFAKGSWVWSSRDGLHGGVCLACSAEQARNWNAKPSSRSKRQESRAQRLSIPEKLMGVKLTNKAWRAANVQSIHDRHARWAAENGHLLNSYSAKRRAAKLQATPPWLPRASLAKIDVYYKIAAALSRVHGIKYHVDHIVPLQGKLVTGLHTPWNLQVIPATINISKGNSYEL